MQNRYKGMSAPLLATGVVNSVLFGLQFNIVGKLVEARGAAPRVERRRCGR